MHALRTRHRTFLAILFAAIFLIMPRLHAQAHAVVDRVSTVDNAVRVRLPHSTSGIVQTGTDQGAVNANLRMEKMLLVFNPADSSQNELRTFLDSQHDKKSANYHGWLTAAQFGERFGPSTADVTKITNWLAQQGFDDIKIPAGRSHVQFSGNAQLVERAFQTRMHSYQTATGKFLANATDISIPQAMSGIIRGVRLHSNAFSKPNLILGTALQRDASGRLSPVTPSPDFSLGSNFLSPGDFARVYNVNGVLSSGVNGSGVTIAIVGRSNISLNDVEVFRQAFSLPLNDPNIIINGQDPGITLSGDDVEAALDVEWAGAVAPGAKVDLVVSPSTATTDGVLLSSIYIVDNNLADVMSVSFGACEQSIGPDNALFNSLWQQAAAQGMSVVVASGDTGAAGCDPNFLSTTPAQGGLGVNGIASTPFNTAVGGTELNENGNSVNFWTPTGQVVTVLGYIPEVVWNQSCDPAVTPSCFAFTFDSSGGGISTVYPKPDWQSVALPGMPNDGQRDLPDVSLAASSHDGYLICATTFAPCSVTANGTQITLLNAGFVGGTSASAPSFAGLLALVDQKQGGRQGLANYVLYRLAANETFANCASNARTDPTVPAPAACVFNDVTQGTNGVPGNDVSNIPIAGALGYPAVTGFDLATGLGSVDALNLVNAWNSVSFQGSTTALSTAASTTIQHGQSIALATAVQPLAGSGSPTGTVSIIANLTVPEPNPSPFSHTVGVASGALTNGAFTALVNSLPGGQYNLVAHYPGDGVFAASDSAPLQVTVAPEPSVVALSALDPAGNSLTSVDYGRPFIFHTAVTPASGKGHATGFVTLTDAGAAIAQLPVDESGVADLTNCSPGSAVCLIYGTHNVTATYSGDSSLNPGSSAQPLSLTITHGTPGLFFGGIQTVQPLFLSQTELFGFGNVPPTGTFTYFDINGVVTSQISDPVPVPVPASLPVFRQFVLPTGNNSVTVQYSGDANYLPTSITVDAGLFQADANPATQTTITALTNPMVVGQIADFQVTVISPSSGKVPVGSLQILLDGQNFPNSPPVVNLVNGSVVAAGIVPRAGLYVNANFFGDAFAWIELCSQPQQYSAHQGG